MQQIQLGVSTACFYPLETDRAFMEMSKRGIKNAEVFLNTFSEVTTEFVRELKEVADFYEVCVASLHPFTCAFEPFLLFTKYERRFKDGLDLYRTYFEAMRILDAKIFVFHGDRAASSLEDQEYYERFGILRDIGKEYGIIVAQENVERCKSRSLPFLKAMAKYLNDDLAIVFDNKQAVRSGIDYRLFIEALGKYIVHVHVSDNGENGSCLPIGQGSLDFSDFFNRLSENGFCGKSIIELYSEQLTSYEDIFNSFTALKDFFHQNNKLFD